MENLQKSNALLEAIAGGAAFDKDSGLLWEHWLKAIEEQIEENNAEFDRVLDDSSHEDSGLNKPVVNNNEVAVCDKEHHIGGKDYW